MLSSLLAVLVAGSVAVCGCERHDLPVGPEPPRTAATPPAPSPIVPPPPPSAGGAASPPLPPELAGVHHVDAADEINLAIEPDGTFRWRIWGCDFDGGDCGRWVLGEGGVVLLPAAGRKTFTWDDGTSFNNPVSKVVVRASQPPGTWSVVASRASSNERIEQTWKAGRVCKKCGHQGPLPSGHELCSDPIPPCEP